LLVFPYFIYFVVYSLCIVLAAVRGEVKTIKFIDRVATNTVEPLKADNLLKWISFVWSRLNTQCKV